MALPFARFVLATRPDDLPSEVMHQARRCLLDLAGVAAAGRRTRLATIIADHAAAHFAAGSLPARILFDGRPVSPAGAALAGGMMINSLDAHDGHRLTKGHAGCGLLPSILAVALAEGLPDGAELLTRLAIGYEIATRAGMALHATAPDYHTSGAWVALACAGVGARALGLDEGGLAHAVGIAEYHGPRSQMMRVIDHPTMLKDGSGWGAMAGTSAAYLAASGFTGAPAVTLEAEPVRDIWADLGERWRIHEQYFKAWPVCRWAQPAVEAVLSLVAERQIAPAAIARIEVRTFHEACRLAARTPADTEQAQYSLPFPVAAAAARGRLTPEDVTGDALGDPEILGLASRVELIEDEAMNAAFPARRFAEAVIVTTDGERFASARTEARGDPEIPLDDAALEEKFRAYCLPSLGARRTEALFAAIAALGEGGDITDLARLLTEPLAAA